MNLEGLIPIAGGIVIMLFANGTFPKNQKNPAKLEAWRKKFGPAIKILGPVVILFGVVQLFGILG
ncbi:MAG: hypothetical protein HY351_03855 [Candidatus Omnitrophica bacterium]|nr:hypothetical protein [Candidatus Omnitrophota bacterium]